MENVILNKVIYPLLSKRATYGDELLNIGKKLIPGFTGVYTRDMIPKHFHKIIVNLDKKTGKGSHWTACIRNQRTNNEYWFDSFGRTPVLNRLAGGHKHTDMKVTKGFKEKDRDNDCGQRCLTWLIYNHYFKRAPLYGI